MITYLFRTVGAGPGGKQQQAAGRAVSLSGFFVSLDTAIFVHLLIFCFFIREISTKPSREWDCPARTVVTGVSISSHISLTYSISFFTIVSLSFSGWGGQSEAVRTGTNSNLIGAYQLWGWFRTPLVEQITAFSERRVPSYLQIDPRLTAWLNRWAPPRRHWPTK